ncbi:hypothetical protein IX339_001903 [Porphyromonas levii]|nr:hypothetical protein [Porphyromonas levii]
MRGDETMQSLAKRYEVSPSKITEWMRELEEKAVQAFEKPSDSTKELKKREFDLSDGDFVRFSDNFQI